MRKKVVFICGVLMLLVVVSAVSAQRGPGNGRGGRGNPPPPNGGQGGQFPPPPGGGNGQGGQFPPPPPGGGQGQGGPQGPNGGGGGNGGGIDFPAGYASSFAFYAVVDRPDNITRRLFISPESLAALQSGQPLPDGTRLVIEAYDATPGADGHLVAGNMLSFVHVSEKIGGRWRFASFTTAGTRADPSIADQNPRTCAGCHNDTRDFVFSRPQIDAFAQTQTTQYVFCGQTGREPC